MRNWLLVVIIVLAGWLRFYRLDSLPPGLHRDEAATGWNAYAIVKTGQDEHQRKLPLVFESFGDWKRPLNIYLTAGLIPFFGLNEFSVRAPIAGLGTVSVLLVYLLTKELLGQKPGENETVPLLTAGLLAISPWHVFMSRTGLGWNIVGLFLTMLAIYWYLAARGRWWLTSLSALVFGLTLFSYASNQIFTPLFLPCLTVGQIRLRRFRRRQLVPVVVFGLFFAVFLKIYLPVFRINAIGSGFFNRVFVYQKIETPQNRHSGLLLAKALHNKFWTGGLEFAKNYLSVLSPQFLFFNDRDNPAYSLENVGNLYLGELPLIIIGLFLLLRREKAASKVLIPWLLLAVVPAALTKTPYSSTRTILVLPVLLIAAADAIVHLHCWLKTQTLVRARVYLVGIGLIYLAFFAAFVDEYFVHFPVNRAGHWGGTKKAAVLVLAENQADYQQILVASPQESFYIYLLFYLKYQPKQFWDEVQYYPLTADGFKHVSQLGKYHFREINYPEDLAVPGRLVVDQSEKAKLWLGGDGIRVIREIEAQAGQGGSMILSTGAVETR